VTALSPKKIGRNWVKFQWKKGPISVFFCGEISQLGKKISENENENRKI
jgi:hypothetical protein